MTEANNKKGFWQSFELSALVAITGIIVLFSSAVIVTLIAPNFVDPTWTQPTTPYQVQMHEISDPNFYISSSPIQPEEIQAVYHLKNGFTLLAFQESYTTRILASKELEKYVTRYQSSTPLKLTSKVLLLRPPADKSKADALQKELNEEWKKSNPKETSPNFVILELFEPKENEAFAVAPTDGVLEDWVDENFVILDKNNQHSYHNDPGVIFINNPLEYKVQYITYFGKKGWLYDPAGEPIASLEQLKGGDMGFRSRQELIQIGETIYAHEGCWYCHTDQTRTLVQDVVLNGSDSFPAPPSSPNEYIYNRITFPGTHRIGPDLSRVGIKRPSRDWHRSHFWSPKTASKGSIMPAFQHFFDEDPRGSSVRTTGIPNYKFEAIYQYLMTKGTRITPPTQAWWLGKDPINTINLIEGARSK